MALAPALRSPCCPHTANLCPTDRDKDKKYTAEEEAEFDRQEREHNSHKGRDALGGAAVGGTAYEAEKHHHDHHQAATDKPLPTAPGNHGIGTGAGPQNALASDNTTSTSSGHHLGRDAGVAAGGAGLAEHEHRKHENLAGHQSSGITGSSTGAGAGALGGHGQSTHTGTHGAIPLEEKPRGTDIGDKLHGVERNRGVPGPTGFPDSQGYGTGSSTAGTGTGVGSSTTGTGTGIGSTTGTGTGIGSTTGAGTGIGSTTGAGSGIGSTTATGTQHQHHLGRETGAGGVPASGTETGRLGPDTGVGHAHGQGQGGASNY